MKLKKKKVLFFPDHILRKNLKTGLRTMLPGSSYSINTIFKYFTGVAATSLVLTD